MNESQQARTGRILCSAAAICSTVVFASPGLAEAPKAEPPRAEEYSFDSDEPCPYCQPGTRGLHWHDHWSRVGLWEYILTPTLGAVALATYLVIPDADDANWSGPVLFDKATRDVLRFDSRSSRTTAKTVSDVLLFTSIAQPAVIDGILVAWIGRQAPDVAWQMSWINAQAYALTLSLNAVVKRFTERERPWGENCPDDTGEWECGSGTRYRSFYSAHASVTATGAGLVCAHHTQLGLYKNPVLDTASCLTAVALTATTGVLRVSSDNHWASDVAVGHLMGYASGYLLPTLLYYHEFRISPKRRGKDEPVVAVLPMATDDSLQLSAVGIF